jgi:hypothetical protein
MTSMNVVIHNAFQCDTLQLEDYEVPLPPFPIIANRELLKSVEFENSKK